MNFFNTIINYKGNSIGKYCIKKWIAVNLLTIDRTPLQIFLAYLRTNLRNNSVARRTYCKTKLEIRKVCLAFENKIPSGFKKKMALFLIGSRK